MKVESAEEGGLPPSIHLSPEQRQQLDNVFLFKIQLRLDAIEDDKSNSLITAGRHEIIVTEYYKGRREPYPKVIPVYMKQKVEVYESKYFLSVYPTEVSTLIMDVKKENVHFTSDAPSTNDANKLKYGPFKNVEPLSFSQMQIFYTYPHPLPIFKKATRDIYVSHWGSVAVDEYFKLFNEGAGIKGQFSRIDYMPHVNPNNGQNAIGSLGIELPQYIDGLYYYDYIGNISSSHALRTQDGVDFTIEPRFPIFGQWKTDWNQGYNMPSHYHLFRDKNDKSMFTLEVDFMHAFDKSVTEKYQVRVILPEGASDIQVELASDVSPDSITVDKYFGTMNFVGRPMIVIKKTDAVHDICDSTIRVRYRFNNPLFSLLSGA